MLVQEPSDAHLIARATVRRIGRDAQHTDAESLSLAANGAGSDNPRVHRVADGGRGAENQPTADELLAGRV